MCLIVVVQLLIYGIKPCAAFWQRVYCCAKLRMLSYVHRMICVPKGVKQHTCEKLENFKVLFISFRAVEKF